LITLLEKKEPLTLDQRCLFGSKALRHTSEFDAAYSLSIRKASGPQKVLVIGNGGREHAMAWKLTQSSRVSTVFVAPGNGGTANAGCTNVNLNQVNLEEVVTFCKTNDISLVVVGPEIPLVAGLSDALIAANIRVFGPSKLAAQIEGSKAFSKALMHKYNIPTAAFETFTTYEAAKAYVDKVGYKVVVKASGLAAGKGVLMPETPSETDAALKEVRCSFYLFMKVTF
jgi:phosphoribosylamine--glycine ligase